MEVLLYIWQVKKWGEWNPLSISQWNFSFDNEENEKKQRYFTFLSFSLSSMENDFQLSTPEEFTKLNKNCQTYPMTRALSCGSTTLHPEHIKIGTYFMWTVFSTFFSHAVFSSHPKRCREKLREVLTFVTRTWWIQAVLPIKGKRKRKF